MYPHGIDWFNTIGRVFPIEYTGLNQTFVIYGHGIVLYTTVFTSYKNTLNIVVCLTNLIETCNNNAPPLWGDFTVRQIDAAAKNYPLQQLRQGCVLLEEIDLQSTQLMLHNHLALFVFNTKSAKTLGLRILA